MKSLPLNQIKSPRRHTVRDSHLPSRVEDLNGADLAIHSEVVLAIAKRNTLFSNHVLLETW